MARVDVVGFLASVKGLLRFVVMILKSDQSACLYFSLAVFSGML